MPPPPPRPAAGQASLEYVGLLALVAAALAVAAPAAGLAGVPAEISRVVRTGVCIVGGDVCRAADAAAAGLRPCTLSDERRGGGLAVTIMSVRVGGGHQWLVARRSDGSVAVTQVARDDVGASAGLGYELGPLKAGVEGEAGLRVASGVGWEFPDAASARRFLAAAHYGLSGAAARWPAAWRSGEAGLATSGWAGLGLVLTGEDGKGIEGPAAGIEISAESVLGARISRGATTLYLRAEAEGPQGADIIDGHFDAGSRGPVVAEYTRDRSGPRELAFRVTARGAGEHEVVETVARLDLRVARVLECREHANADKLLVMKVDLGTGEGGGQRQICAVLKNYYKPEDLVGRLVIVLANLEPRSMRGEVSQGLVLSAAEGPMKQRVVVLSPTADVAPGSTVG